LAISQPGFQFIPKGLRSKDQDSLATRLLDLEPLQFQPRRRLRRKSQAVLRVRLHTAQGGIPMIVE